MSAQDFGDMIDIPRVKIKLLYDQSKMPDRKHPGDAGWDLYAAFDVDIWPGEVALVKTGIAIELPEGWEAQVRARSGLALKHGIFCVNGVGTIDEQYRGEIGVILSKCTPGKYSVTCGDAVAQMVIKRVPGVRLLVVDDLGESQRGTGGYGSTGR